jgi:hypothetical protein
MGWPNFARVIVASLNGKVVGRQWLQRCNVSSLRVQECKRRPDLRITKVRKPAEWTQLCRVNWRGEGRLALEKCPVHASATT